MNNGIDIAFLVTKVATLNNEKAKLFVDAASFAYNVAQVSRLQSLIIEYSQVCNYVVLNAKYRGYYTEDEFKLANDCQRHIQECNQQLAKHRTMTVVDGISLLLDALNGLEKK